MLNHMKLKCNHVWKNVQTCSLRGNNLAKTDAKKAPNKWKIADAKQASLEHYLNKRKT